jgi:hypothetical protein
MMNSLRIGYPELFQRQYASWPARSQEKETLLAPPVIATTSMESVSGVKVFPVVSVTHSKWSPYADYTAELLLPEELRLSGIFAQQIPEVAC